MQSIPKTGSSAPKPTVLLRVYGGNHGQDLPRTTLRMIIEGLLAAARHKRTQVLFREGVMLDVATRPVKPLI